MDGMNPDAPVASKQADNRDTPLAELAAPPGAKFNSSI
jgi:hypothetical protein